MADKEIISKETAVEGGVAGLSGFVNVAAYELYLKNNRLAAAAVTAVQAVAAFVVPGRPAKVAALSGAIIQGSLLVLDLVAGN